MTRIFQILLILLLLALIFIGLSGRPEAEAPPPEAPAEATIEAPTPALEEPSSIAEPDSTNRIATPDTLRTQNPPERIEQATQPSGLIIPVAGIGPEDLRDTFEDARSANRTHDAIDIMAPHRTPVLAATDGRIARLFESENGGLTIYQIAPDERTVYYYAHLDGYAPGLAAGDTVRQGQILGYVGDTGNAEPGNYHLHFAIWLTDDPADFWDGVPVNPFPLLRGED